jgi:hypothetical protein
VVGQGRVGDHSTHADFRASDPPRLPPLSNRRQEKSVGLEARPCVAARGSATGLDVEDGVDLFDVVEVVAGDELGETLDAFFAAFPVNAELFALFGF